jgi:hypothetical protein
VSSLMAVMVKKMWRPLQAGWLWMPSWWAAARGDDMRRSRKGHSQPQDWRPGPWPGQPGQVHCSNFKVNFGSSELLGTSSHGEFRVQLGKLKPPSLLKPGARRPGGRRGPGARRAITARVHSEKAPPWAHGAAQAESATVTPPPELALASCGNQWRQVAVRVAVPK